MDDVKKVCGLYMRVLEDMHNHRIISTDTYDKVLGYEEQKKEKDDYEL